MKATWKHIINHVINILREQTEAEHYNLMLDDSGELTEQIISSCERHANNRIRTALHDAGVEYSILIDVMLHMAKREATNTQTQIQYTNYGYWALVLQSQYPEQKKINHSQF